MQKERIGKIDADSARSERRRMLPLRPNAEYYQGGETLRGDERCQENSVYLRPACKVPEKKKRRGGHEPSSTVKRCLGGVEAPMERVDSVIEYSKGRMMKKKGRVMIFVLTMQKLRPKRKRTLETELLSQRGKLRADSRG